MVAGPLRARLDVHAQGAVRMAWIARDELVDDDAAGALGDTSSQPEVQLADRVGVGERGAFERAAPKGDVDVVGIAAHRRIEAVERHPCDELVEGGVGGLGPQTFAPRRAPADLDRGIPAADDLGEEQRQALVRCRPSPVLARGG